MTELSLFNEIPTGAAITEIATVASNPNLRRIKVAGKTIARLSASDVDTLGLEVGSKWSKALAVRVAQAMEGAKARKLAMTTLGKRALSRGELVERLMRRGHSEKIASHVADELQADHWIDDEAYATAIAEELVQQKSATTAMIVDRLVRRRIDESLARKVAAVVLNDVDPVDAATALTHKRLATMKGVAQERAVRRIAGWLARRGYDEETIGEALSRNGLM